MAKIETDCDMDCVRMSFSFQRFKIGSKIVEILQNRCCSLDFLQEIVLIIYLELIKFLAHTFRGHIS